MTRLALVLAAAAFAFAAPAARAATFTVTSAGDAGDADTADGVCATVEARCTLRAAIQQANAKLGADAIGFSLGAGASRISPGSALPVITEAVAIDGSSSAPLGGTPRIELSGNAAGNANGLVIAAEDASVRGLIVNRWAQEGIWIQSGSGNVVAGNWLGTTADGRDAAPNARGVVVYGNRSTIEGNVVSGNTGDGIVIAGSAARGNAVRQNLVGLDADGTAGLANGGEGIFAGTGVGLGAPTATTIAGNHASFNAEEGIVVLDAPDTRIEDNVVGLDVAGHVRGNTRAGIDVDNAPDAIVKGNVVSGNGYDGVLVYGSGAARASIGANRVGTDLTGTKLDDGTGAPTGNARFGINLTTLANGGGASDAVVEGNVVAGNRFGVGLISDAHGNKLKGNFIGTDAARAADLGNREAGVYVLEAHDNAIGGKRGDPGNVIAGNDGDGVRIEGPQAKSNHVQGNDIGEPFANFTGVTLLGGANNNVVGHPLGSAPDPACAGGECNVIAGNTLWGVLVAGGGASNTVRGNRIRANGALGIDLGEQGVTANDTGDADKAMNFPVGVSAYTDPQTGRTFVSGVLDHPHPESATIDVYGSAERDPSHAGEGERWLAEATPSVNGSFRVEIASPAKFYSATATDRAGDTSEFSPVCGDPDDNGSTDNDADGLCDDWEAQGPYAGIDFDGDRTPDLRLSEPPFDARVNRRDVFVEVDSMPGHAPEPGALADVTAAFAGAPGGGVALHAMVDESVPELDPLPVLRRPGSQDDFGDLKDGDPSLPCDGAFGTAAERARPDCANVLGARRLAFRYALFIGQMDEAPDNSGAAELGSAAPYGGNDFVVSLGAWGEDEMTADGGGGLCKPIGTCRRNMEAGTFMHELGHTLGLNEGGGDAVKYKPNYLSVMNYSFQSLAYHPTRPLDYSRRKLGSLHEKKLDERKGIDDGGVFAPWGRTVHSYIAPGGRCLMRGTGVKGPIDWDQSGHIAVVDVSASINDPDGCDPAARTDLNGFDDWANLHYDFRDTEGFNGTGYGFGERVGREVAAGDGVRAARTTDFDGDGTMNADDDCPQDPACDAALGAAAAPPAPAARDAEAPRAGVRGAARALRASEAWAISTALRLHRHAVAQAAALLRR